MPAPLLLAALPAITQAVTAQKGAVAGVIAQGLMSAFDPNAKAYRKELRDTRERLRKNDFGMSEAEKNSAMSSVTRQQQAAARGTADEIRRQGAAMGGRTAASAEALRGVTSDLAGQAAAARGGLEAESANLASQQREAAKAMIANRKVELAGMAGQVGQAAVGAAASGEMGARNFMAARKDYETLAPGVAGSFKGTNSYALGKSPLLSQDTSTQDEVERLRRQEEMFRRLLDAKGGSL